MPYVVMVVVGGFLFGSLQGSARDVGMDLGDGAHGLGASLPEDHAGVGSDVLWVLDEAETAAGLVSCPKVVFVHGYDGGCLSGTSTVNCIILQHYIFQIQVRGDLNSGVHFGTHQNVL